MAERSRKRSEFAAEWFSTSLSLVQIKAQCDLTSSSSDFKAPVCIGMNLTVSRSVTASIDCLPLVRCAWVVVCLRLPLCVLLYVHLCAAV